MKNAKLKQQSMKTVFNLKTNIVIKKEFSIEADTLKEAMDLVQEQIYKNEDLNVHEITRVEFDMTDPTIREYNRKMAREAVVDND